MLAVERDIPHTLPRRVNGMRPSRRVGVVHGFSRTAER